MFPKHFVKHILYDYLLFYIFKQLLLLAALGIAQTLQLMTRHLRP